MKQSNSKKLPQILAILKKQYPTAHCELHYSNPLELLIATILSAQCTDVRVNQVTPLLFKKYKTAADYAKVPQKTLEKEIRSTGFFRQKTLWIRTLAVRLCEQHQGNVPKTMEELVSLPGVARKTANVVLGSAYGIASGIVVDTHMKRVSYRLGLTLQKDPVKVEKDLLRQIPRKSWIWFSHAMVWHGRRVCKAISPRCPECPLRSVCPQRGV
ncbi:MAG: endonuclease III [Elusimicrobia bacterium]|nr:endonuclease III [Elusimicrobiota bacterium]